MSLDEQIKQQYERRRYDNRYSSVYARFADAELEAGIGYMVKKYLGGNSTVLEIGAGHGGNAEFFMHAGIRPEAIFLNELLHDRAQLIRKNYPHLVLYEGNALDIDFDRKFDCVFQSTVFTSILGPGDRKKLAAKMWELLNPGGIILWYDFIYNNPSNPDVRKVSVREMRALFPYATHSEILKITLAPPVGRRVGKFYKLFNVPFLRSHVLAAFRK